MSVSNTSAIPMLAGSKTTIDHIRKPAKRHARHSKIICTIGPACWKVHQLEALIDAGMTVARFNFSHGDHEGHAACLARLREAAMNKKQNIAVMLDTKGPEIRTGYFAGEVSKILLRKENSIIITSDYTFEGDANKLACSYLKLANSVNPGQIILVADGTLVLKVLSTDVDAGEVTCKIMNTTSIGERKNMNLPGVVVALPTLTDKDVDDIQQWGVKNDIDFVAASFVRKASDVNFIRHALSDAGGQGIKIISKIENLEGLQNYDEILRATDGIMVARGDLGMELPPEKVFLAQKMMIREANIAGKPVVTATQMLESMICSPRPTRAECSDIANAVLDGTDCVMLSGETANGQYFEEAVNIMAKICAEAESTVNYNMVYQAIRHSSLIRYGKMSSTESIASSAVMTAYDVSAKLIVVLSESGNTARMIAKFRPGMPVCVLTPSARVARQVFGYMKGCYAFIVDSLDDTDRLVNKTTEEVLQAGVCEEGDPYVLVCGNTFGCGATNQIKVQYVNSRYWEIPPETDSSAHNIGRNKSFGKLAEADKFGNGCSIC